MLNNDLIDQDPDGAVSVPDAGDHNVRITIPVIRKYVGISFSDEVRHEKVVPLPPECPACQLAIYRYCVLDDADRINVGAAGIESGLQVAELGDDVADLSFRYVILQFVVAAEPRPFEERYGYFYSANEAVD